MAQTENYIGLGGSTQRLHHKHLEKYMFKWLSKTRLVVITKDYFKERNRRADAKIPKYLSGTRSVYDGGELGSTSRNRKV